MNTIVEHINSAGFSFVEFALPMLIQSCVLIVILLLLDLLLRKKVKAVFRYWIWMLVLLKLVLPTSLSSPLSLGYLFGDKLTYQDLAETTSVLELAGPAPAESLPGINPLYIQPNIYIPPTEPMTSVVEPVIAEPVSPPEALVTPLSWQGVVFLVWLAVVIAMGLLLLQRALFVRGLVAQAKKASRLMNDELAYCCASMGIKCRVRLKVSVNATTPSVCGLIRPVILVPWNLASTLGVSRMRTVLMHELAHIRRADLWVNLAQTILQIIYFYNPLLWLANCMIRRIREQAVDEAVLVAMGEKAQKYPQTLVDVAKMAFKRPALSLRLIGVVESKSALTGRIKHILGRPIPKTAKLGIVGVLAVIIIGAILLPMAKAKNEDKFSDKDLLIKFTELPEGEAKKVSIGDTTIWSKSYEVEFAPGQDLLVAVEMYRAGQPMRIIGRNIFEGSDKPEKFTVMFDRTYQDAAKKAVTHNIQFKLGDQVFKIPVNTPRYLSTQWWDWYRGKGLRRPEMRHTKTMYAGIENLFYYGAANLSMESEDKAKFWIPGRDVTPAMNQYGIALKMIPLSSLKYLSVEPIGGYQGLDGKMISMSLTLEEADRIADEYKQMIIDSVEKQSTAEKQADMETDVQVEVEKTPQTVFTAILPNGVTVELIGVCEHPSEGKKWWRPDGSLLAQAPYDQLYVTSIPEAKPNERVYEFAYRLSNGMDTISISATGEVIEHGGMAIGAKNNAMPTDISSSINYFPKDQKATTLSISSVVFKNVSLRPGVKTDVQVEVEAGTKGAGENKWDVGGVVIKAVNNKATLKSGVSVELSGLTYIPADDQPWWKPDGSPMGSLFDRADYGPGKDPDKDQYNYFAASVRIDGLPPEEVFSPKMKWHAEGAEHTDNISIFKGDENLRGGNLYAAAIKRISKDAKSTDLQLGLAVGEWETIAKGRHMGFYEIGDDTVILREPSRGLGGIRPWDKGWALGVTYTITDQDFRIAVLDEDGQLHPGKRRGGGGTSNLRRMEITFPDLEPKQEKFFLIQTRPYEWIEFKDVSLKPNFKTDVQVEVEKTISPKLVMLLTAINSCAAETDLNVDSISITTRNISIKGDTSNRANTLKFLDAIKKNELEVLQLSFVAGDNRNKFSLVVEPKKDWQKWWQQRKTDVQLGLEENVSPKLVMLLAAFNSVAAETDLKIDSISIKENNIEIKGDTAGRTDTLKFLDAVKDNGLEVLRLSDIARKDNRNKFSITAEPKKDWQKWWQQHKTDVPVEGESSETDESIRVEDRSELVSASIAFHTLNLDGSEVITPAAFTMEIKDKAEVSKLASFFPRMEEKRISGSRPWWNPAATIIFYRSNDTAVVVNVSADMRNWVSDVSQGDWPVNGDMREFLSELKNKTQANTPPEPQTVLPIEVKQDDDPPESKNTEPKAKETEKERGRISGIVVHSVTGEPIVGAYVGVGDFGDSGGSNYSRHREQGFHDKTKTDAEGRFELNGLVFTDKHRELEYHPLVVTHPDFIRHDEKIELLSGGPAPEVKVSLRPAAKIDVTIVDADGNPLEGQWLLRLEALDGRRFIPPGSDPHLSSFASSIWARMPDLRANRGASQGFTFTELDSGEYSIEALKFQLVDNPTPQNVWKPIITYHGSIPNLKIEAGRTKQVRIKPVDYQTSVSINMPEDPIKKQQIPPFVIISRNTGLLLWNDGKAHGPEDHRLGRLQKNALYYNLVVDANVFTIENLPPGSYSVFAGPVYFMSATRVEVSRGREVVVDMPPIQITEHAKVGLWTFNRKVKLQAGDYSVSELCELLTAVTESNPRIIADPSIENEKLRFGKGEMSVWDVLEKLYLDKGWRVVEGKEKTLIIKPAEQTDPLIEESLKQARIVHFPVDRSLGKLCVQRETIGIPVHWWWGLHSQWQYLSNQWQYLAEARGDVTVPSGKRLGLIVGRDGIKALSHLANLRPYDLYMLKIKCGKNAEYNPGDDCVPYLARLTGLKELILEYPGITNEGFEAIRGLNSLERLSLISGQLDDTGMAHIAELKSLRGLRFSSRNVTNVGLSYLSKLTLLEELFPSGIIDDEGLAHLKKLPALRHLLLSAGDFTENGLAHLKEIPSLRKLEVGRIEFSGEGLAHISSIPGLEDLSISHTVFSDEDLIPLKSMNSLKRLSLSPPFQQMARDFTDKALFHLSRIKSLESLVLGYGKFTDKGLEYLTELDDLKRLDIPNNSGFTDAGLSHLTKLSLLEELRLRANQFTDVGMSSIAKLTNLKRLELWGHRADITNKSLARLADMSKLHYLEIKGKFNDEGLAHVGNLKKLNYLDISGDFTDEGLQHLEGLNLLKQLKISAPSELSPQALQDLRSKLPNLLVLN